MLHQTHAAVHATAAPPLTAIVAKFVATHPSGGWNASVDGEAHRAFYNWLGCAIGAAQHEATDIALQALRELAPAPQVSVLGRAERLDMASAALVNGITSHLFDFDDTHLRTVIHPTGPVASAVIAVAEHYRTSGREVMDALVLGIDVACRFGNAMSPDHYDRGWHITGSTGMLGAAAATARLLKLDEQQTAMALGIAASQPVGLREQFGTMTKPFHPGGAARAGLLSTLLASRGFTASPRALEAPRGFVPVLSDKRAWDEVTDALGERFEILSNTYKPFACGIVMHPGIDACVQLHGQGILAEEIERIDLRVHPLVLELTGKKEPRDGLQAKFSVYHGCAVGLIFGAGGEAEFSDACVADARVAALRSRIHATVDAQVAKDAVSLVALLKDGRRIELSVDHAVGSLSNPLSDERLERKFNALVTPVLGQEAAARISAEWKSLVRLPDFATFLPLCCPPATGEHHAV